VIPKLLRLWLLAALGFGLLATAISHLPSTPAPAPPRAIAPQAEAQPVARGRPLADIAVSPQTPLGDAIYRVSCTWTLRRRLADRPEWTTHRAASFCLCLIDRARDRRMHDVPYVGRADFIASVDLTEERLCRGGS
jgi:hypothetical protein